VFVRDHCDKCDGPADVGLVDEPVRISLRIWQCVRCGHLTVTAYDWRLNEIVDAEVLSRDDSSWERVKETLRKKQQKSRERR